ncbi:putative oleosin 16 kDa-like [Iris pallida]|uniref:Oleosin 16 kDa-like n=1 Tax=Iris pallida TaxID=29817 RepID=A0AAX6HGY9_IRIPA|nr:putative oleosin 16 kDa-like [Iris pallida]KAJ6839705.1 putative oleosin 16 kDa-like [Iris pallida]
MADRASGPGPLTRHTRPALSGSSSTSFLRQIQERAPNSTQVLGS